LRSRAIQVAVRTVGASKGAVGRAARVRIALLADDMAEDSPVAAAGDGAVRVAIGGVPGRWIKLTTVRVLTLFASDRVDVIVSASDCAAVGVAELTVGQGSLGIRGSPRAWIALLGKAWEPWAIGLGRIIREEVDFE